ncbi:hypothetical protein BH11ACT2_BH11ACT2_20490 [soil metagenome]
MPDLHEIGRAALGEITLPENVGENAGQEDVEPGVVSVFFENTMTGYPGWRWTVSIATLEGQGPSVLETELTPTDGALLAPDWVPWSDRLADYKASQEALGESTDDDESGDEESDDDEPDDEFEESDDDGDDDLGSDVVHSGDVDGVDIDALDVDADDDPQP